RGPIGEQPSQNCRQTAQQDNPHDRRDTRSRTGFLGILPTLRRPSGRTPTARPDRPSGPPPNGPQLWRQVLTRETRPSKESPLHAVVAELVDAPDSGSGDRKIVGVRLSPTAQEIPGTSSGSRF